MAATSSVSVNKDHQAFATTNFSKSGASGLYDRARPSYPLPAYSQILDLLLPPSPSPSPGATTPTGAHVVELGSGTGLFTRGFLRAAAERARGEGNPVRRVTAVEPSEGMREGFERAMRKEEEAALKGEGEGGGGAEVVCVDGTFEKVPVGDGEADLVVIAQAWHWTGTTQLPAAREVARVLRPGGAWCLIWNLEDRAVRWVAGMRDAYEKFESDTPQYRHGLWKAMYGEPEFHELFTEPTHAKFHRALPTTEDLAVERVFSKSYITALSDAERSELEHELRENLRRGEDRVWIDEHKGVFEYPYETDLFVSRRR
ncbi:S-adenosyl-L-methionine-dependent methyltransferase [Rhodotorula diobovata]|uniref:S-adenosyl-L-methionine-dependent methyltransferase n=1 Tax=Rhodotorula diobovata TaxID=5288 RepID=A0A5C5FQ11_9BASI|nr:S-adenosyl-L-methionine-dependent methyltransferase [Rhodotorula diobovata]